MVCITETDSVYCAVRTGSLCVIQYSVSLYSVIGGLEQSERCIGKCVRVVCCDIVCSGLICIAAGPWVDSR